MTVKLVALALAIAMVASPLSAQSKGAAKGQDSHSHDRDSQWVFRDLSADEHDGQYAIFLSWDYSSVLFRAACDNGTLLLDYYGGDGADAPDLRPISLTRSEATDELTVKSVKVEGKPGAYLARYTVNDQLLAVLKPTKSMLMIDAPIAKDDMAEPWYVGDAEPLYRVAQNCK